MTKHRLAAEPLDIISLLLRSVSNQKLIFALHFDSNIDLARLHLAVTRLQTRLPIIGYRLQTTTAWPIWQRASSADATTNIHFLDISNRNREIIGLISNIAHTSRNTLDILVFRKGSEDSVYICVDHTLADAAGTRELAYLLAQFYAWPGHHTSTPTATNMTSQRGLAKIRQRHSFKQRASAMLRFRATKGHWKFPISDAIANAKPTYQLRRLGSIYFPKLRELCSLYGVTINDLLVSALFCSLCEIHNVGKGSTLPMQFTVDLRRYLPQGRPAQVANLSGSEHVWLQPRSDHDFIGSLLTTHKALRNIKQRTPGLGSALLIEKLFHCSYRGTSALLLKNIKNSMNSRKGNPLLTNLGRINATRLNFDTARVKDACLIGPSQLTPGLTMSASTFRNNLTLSVGYQPDNMGHLYVKNVLSRMIDFLSGQQ